MNNNQSSVQIPLDVTVSLQDYQNLANMNSSKKLRILVPQGTTAAQASLISSTIKQNLAQSQQQLTSSKSIATPTFLIGSKLTSSTQVTPQLSISKKMIQEIQGDLSQSSTPLKRKTLEQEKDLNASKKLITSKLAQSSKVIEIPDSTPTLRMNVADQERLEKLKEIKSLGLSKQDEMRLIQLQKSENSDFSCENPDEDEIIEAKPLIKADFKFQDWEAELPKAPSSKVYKRQTNIMIKNGKVYSVSKSKKGDKVTFAARGDLNIIN